VLGWGGCHYIPTQAIVTTFLIWSKEVVRGCERSYEGQTWNFISFGRHGCLPRDGDGHVHFFHFVCSSFMMDTIHYFFVHSFQKEDFFYSQNYHLFSI